MATGTDAGESGDRDAFAETSAAVSSVLTALGVASTHMAALYEQAIACADAITAEMKRRGQPGQTAAPREQMQWALLGQWLQLAESFASQYLAVTIQQGAQLARASQGPGLVDVRQMRNPPQPRQLRP